MLCLVGTEGSGREAILRTIYGMRKPVGGRLVIKGTAVKAFTQREAVAPDCTPRAKPALFGLLHYMI